MTQELQAWLPILLGSEIISKDVNYLTHQPRLLSPALPRPVFLAAWILIPLSVLVIYLPGLNGPFVFDDLPNIVTNPAIARPGLSSAWLVEILHSGMAGPLGRPLAYLSFGLNYHMAGGFNDTLVFKLTNLFIHIINSLLVWHLAGLLVKHLINTSRLQNRMIVRAIAPLTALLFAVHPIQLTSVLYVVQRMTSLSALFVLGGTSVFLHGRLMLPTRHVRAFLIMAGGLMIGLLGLASKENAILILPLAATIEYIVFTRDDITVNIRNWLRLFYVLIVGVPLLATAFWISHDPSFLLNSYETRDFGPVERLLTESRILWFYIYLLATPRLSTLSLFHDDITISKSLFDPATTFIAVTATITLIVAAIRLRHRFPLFSLPVMWFFIAHALESSILGLELAHEHRNYLPSVGFMLLVSYGISILAVRLSRPATAAVIAGGLVTIFSVTTFARAANWSDEQRMIYNMVESHPQSARAQFMYGEYLLKRAADSGAAIKRFSQAAQLVPTEPAYLIALQYAASSLSTTSSVNRPREPNTLLADDAKQRPQSPSPDISHYFQKQSDQQMKIRLLLHREISQHAAQLLRKKPASPTAISQLSVLLDCVNTSPARCGYVTPYATSWVLAAAKNTSLAAVTRHNLLVPLANIQISRKDYRGALDTALLGVTLTPHDATYRIIAADMLLSLDRCVEAQDQLKSVLENTDSTAEEKSTARMLLQRAEKHPLCRDKSAFTTLPTQLS